MWAPPASAQPAPEPTPPGGTPVPVPRDGVPPVISPTRDPRRLPKNMRNEVPPGETGDGPVRTDGGTPGVIDTGSGPKKTFEGGGDLSNPGAGDLPPGIEDSDEKLNDVIEWKTNFEKGAKCQKIPLDQEIHYDFNEITLGDLTKLMSCITGQNFLLTGGANRSATVSILSPKKVTVYEAYKAYLSALEANGLTIIPNGKFLEIWPSGESKSRGGPIYGPGRAGPNTDQMITRLIPLEHIPAEEILPVIDKFKTGAADITVYGPTNTIIITDTGTNIRRLMKLVADLDVPIGKERIWIRPIVNASASEIATLLGQIIGTSDSGGGGAAATATTGRGARNRKLPNPPTRTPAGQPQPANPQAADQGGTSSVIGQTSGDLTSIQVSKMIADERTNSLIFVATRTAYIQVDKIIRKLDVAIPGEGSYHIHPLENADAEEIAQTLSALAQGRSSSGTTRRPRGGAAGDAGGAAGGAGGAAGAGAGPTSGELFEGDVKITAYKPKNSLVIEASLKDYLTLQKVIRQLDVRRKQVYVEAIIMEISQLKDRNVALSGSGGTTFDLNGETLPLLFGVGGLGADFTGALDTVNKGGGAAVLQGPLLNVDTGTGADTGSSTFKLAAFGFTLKALQTTTNVNVLSTPHILTLENEEATIQVGKRQPYQSTSIGAGLGGLSGLGSLLGGSTGSSALSGLNLSSLAGGLGTSSVQYVDVDLTLKIKPTVNASDFVRMEIDQSLDDIDGFGAGQAPITSKRKVTNVVEVRDGQPVVIGGLIRDQETQTVDKVPFLGDIPLLGLLFRRTKTTVEKRNLLLIIVPHVIKDPSDLKRIYEERQSEYREFARVMAERKKEYEGELDYRKKSGVLEDIHRTVDAARAERELRERAIYNATDLDPVGPPETHDIEYDPRQHLTPDGGSPDDDEVPVVPPTPAPAPAPAPAPNGGTP
ncbi:MAG: type II secretion system secretin GspD [Myxococcota bacterium]